MSQSNYISGDRISEFLEGVALADDGRAGIAVGWNGTILTTADGGNSWKKHSVKDDIKDHILHGIVLSDDGRTGIVVGQDEVILWSHAQDWSLPATKEELINQIRNNGLLPAPSDLSDPYFDKILKAFDDDMSKLEEYQKQRDNFMQEIRRLDQNIYFGNDVDIGTIVSSMSILIISMRLLIFMSMISLAYIFVGRSRDNMRLYVFYRSLADNLSILCSIRQNGEQIDTEIMKHLFRMSHFDASQHVGNSKGSNHLDPKI